MRRFLLGIALSTVVFTVGAGAQTATPGVISGSIINENRNGISGVGVLVLDLTTLEAQWATTNAFGRFRAEGLALNNQYLVQVYSRRAVFRFSSLAVNMDSAFKEVTFHGTQYPVSPLQAPKHGF